jgi:hypothetical protein
MLWTLSINVGTRVDDARPDPALAIADPTLTSFLSLQGHHMAARSYPQRRAIAFVLRDHGKEAWTTFLP